MRVTSLRLLSKVDDDLAFRSASIAPALNLDRLPKPVADLGRSGWTGQ